MCVCVWPYRAGNESEEKESLVTEAKLGHRRSEGRNLGASDLGMKDGVVLKNRFMWRVRSIWGWPRGVTCNEVGWVEFRGDKEKMRGSGVSESEQKIETFSCGKVWEGTQWRSVRAYEEGIHGGIRLAEEEEERRRGVYFRFNPPFSFRFASIFQLSKYTPTGHSHYSSAFAQNVKKIKNVTFSFSLLHFGNIVRIGFHAQEVIYLFHIKKKRKRKL